MKALSIKQPWAELILQRKKTIEIRTWNTEFRGYFLIHASGRAEHAALRIYRFNLKDLLLGALVGVAKLVDVVVYRNRKDFLKDRDRHLSLPGYEKYPLYGFVLEDVKRIKPIKYKGKLGFFEVSETTFRKNL